MLKLLKQLFKFSIVKNKPWFGPLVCFLIIVGLFFIFVQVSTTTPLIYSIF